MNHEIVIVAATRTALGSFGGSLSSIPAHKLGAEVIASLLKKTGVNKDQIDEVILGQVLTAGSGQNPARQAAIEAGIPVESGATTINKLCGSGMKAAMMAHDLIKAGSNEIMVAGGMESMSNAPYLMPKARTGYRMGHTEVKDSMFLDGLEDAKTGRLMGSFAQDMADQYQMTREDMDGFAIRSLKRAQKAIDAGHLKAESVSVTIKSRAGETVVEDDEQPGAAKIDKIPSLKPAFKADGTVTAANSSSISDGASALVIASEEAIAKNGMTPMAKILGHTTNSRHPSEFTIAPIGAIEKLLDKVGWSADEVDLFEINEAFAMVTMAAIKDLGLDPEKVNISGGACAQGHPVGSTGSRIIVTLMYALKRLNLKKGVAALCIGGGEATAIAIELV
jgi:acetyl-CoA C-acetyltransferase